MVHILFKNQNTDANELVLLKQRKKKPPNITVMPSSHPTTHDIYLSSLKAYPFYLQMQSAKIQAKSSQEAKKPRSQASQTPCFGYSCRGASHIPGSYFLGFTLPCNKSLA